MEKSSKFSQRSYLVTTQSKDSSKAGYILIPTRITLIFGMYGNINSLILIELAKYVMRLIHGHESWPMTLKTSYFHFE